MALLVLDLGNKAYTSFPTPSGKETTKDRLTNESNIISISPDYGWFFDGHELCKDLIEQLIEQLDRLEAGLPK